MDRRDFLAASATTVAAAVTAGEPAAAQAPQDGAAAPGGPPSVLPRRRLGRTNEMVSIVGLGGFHVGKQRDENESISLIRAAVDGGITFLDNCWDYNGGDSEVRMGKALRDGYRARAYLMTKMDGRNAASFDAQLDESLRRLQTDRVDLVQFHEIIRMNDADRIFAPGGAMEAALRAQRADKARHIGFTGHKHPAMMLRMLDLADANGVRFDSVQMPLNVMDAHFESFEKLVLPRLVLSDIGVIGMKPMGDPFILGTGTVSAVECLRYAMSLPVSVTVTGIDNAPVLQQALAVARDFQPLTPAEREVMLSRTAEAARDGRHELYKVSEHFDGTAKNPHWLG